MGGTNKGGKAKEAPDFEATLKAIESLVDKLEDENTPLNSSLGYFEEGIGLIRQAQKLLAEAEQKVMLLTESEDGPEATALDPESEDEA